MKNKLNVIRIILAAVRDIFAPAGRGVFALFKTALVLLLAFFMVWVNFTVDCSGYYHASSYEHAAALQMLAGNSIADYDKLNNRLLNQMYAENLTGELDTLALGSSRIKQLTCEIVGTDSFYNASVSGSDFYDMAGTFYLFVREGHVPKNLILGIDPWLLNPDSSADNPRSDRELYNEYLSAAAAGETGYVPQSPFAKWAPLFDLSYFQGNINYFLRGAYTHTDTPGTETPAVVTGDPFKQSTNVLSNDGSLIYTPDFRNLSLAEVAGRAHIDASTFLGMDNFFTLDSARCALFNQFIQYAQSLGVNVIFLMSPYHPLMYEYAVFYKQNYAGFFWAETWFTDYAKNKDIPLYGSYNSYALEYYEEDFYDGLHMRRETLAGFFPSLAEIAVQQEAGTAGSAWQYRSEMVPYTAAERIVATINNLPPPQTLVRGEDEVIEGESAYVLLRYAGAPGTSTLLARYAVVKSTGYYYRYDTSIGGWVHDRRI